MTELLSHPFRIGATGNIVTQEETADSYLAERLSLIMTVRNGERTLVSDFGLGDLEYEGVLESAILTQVALWAIPVVILGVTETVRNDQATDYTIEFETDTEVEDV